MKVKVIGAGSIGNHMAQASRRMGWDVDIVGRSTASLERTKTEIYPGRYGAWDDAIRLFQAGQEPKGGYDIIVIGTPPDTHMPLALNAITENPRVLHIEKALCTPDLAGVEDFKRAMKNHPKTIVTVGYDHAVAESIEAVAELVKKGLFGEILTADVEFREHWRGIMNAHPWLSGPQDAYMGYWKRGGGAGCELSHGLHLWRHFAEQMGWGKISRVDALFDIKQENGAEYDRLAAFHLRTEKGNVGRVVQDVITYPPRKWLRLQGAQGFIEWYCNGVPEGDLIKYQVEGKELVEKVFPKKRPDDFYRETLHYADLLSGKIKPEDSPLSFDRGLEVMKLLNKSYMA